jgi:hypothetical protein
MIDAYMFSAFYGNDLTPTTNFSVNVSNDQAGNSNVTSTSSSTLTNITTDKIPIKIEVSDFAVSLSWQGILYADQKEANDSSDATTSISTSGFTTIYVQQGKKLTITLKVNTTLPVGETAHADLLLFNALTNKQINNVYLELINTSGIE